MRKPLFSEILTSQSKQEDICMRGDFDVGYLQSNSVVTLRSSEDIARYLE